ncbi:10328_t:CDS:2, partial [Gigaspora margarita]
MNEKKAIELFKQAADKNVPGVQLHYAFSFIKNNTLRRKDQSEFIKYLTQAADKGNYIAQFNLGDLYINCNLEFQADKEKGEGYLKLPAKNGHYETVVL